MEMSGSLDARLDQLAGQELGAYRVIRVLGRGAMAVVFLAEQRSLSRFVAVKILRPSLAVDDTYVKRFQQEARAAASLVHPNIVQIYEVGQTGPLHYIAQEYVAGRNLKQLMVQHAAFPPHETVAILKQVAAALDKAQEFRLVHRDIKPENILLGSDGLVKVADFGLARVTSDRDQRELTKVGFTMGTPLYMSPEQVEGKPLDARSDIYSLGITAFHMLTGRPPFDGETPFSIAVQHVKNAPPSLAALRPNLPGAFVQLIESMIQKDCAARPANGQELLARLNRLELGTNPGASSRVAMAVPWLSNSSGTLEATKQLAALIGNSTASVMPGHVPRTFSGWRLGLLGALVVGMALAGISTRRDPLEPLRFARRNSNPSTSVEERYHEALLENSEQVWLDFLQSYPEERGIPANRYYSLDATCQLARWYLSHDQFERAIPWLERLTRLEDTEKQYQAEGFAGLLIAHVGRQELPAARAAQRQLEPLRGELLGNGDADFLQQDLVEAERQLPTRGPPNSEETPR